MQYNTIQYKHLRRARRTVIDYLVEAKERAVAGRAKGILSKLVF